MFPCMVVKINYYANEIHHRRKKANGVNARLNLENEINKFIVFANKESLGEM